VIADVFVLCIRYSLRAEPWCHEIHSSNHVARKNSHMQEPIRAYYRKNWRGAEQAFGRWFADGLYRGSVSTAAQATIRWPVIKVLMRAFLLFLPLLRGQQSLSRNCPFSGGWLFNRGQNVVCLLSNWSLQNVVHVRTKKVWYKCRRVCQCFNKILSCLMWSFHWTDAWQHGIYSVN